LKFKIINSDKLKNSKIYYSKDNAKEIKKRYKKEKDIKKKTFNKLNRKIEKFNLKLRGPLIFRQVKAFPLC
jgi:hypothetical protein